jgi:hypothetical protein
MKNTRKTAALMVALVPLWAACQGDTGVYLSTDKTEITSGGVEFATIVADVQLAGDPVDNGTLVHFSTTAGSFSQAEVKQSEEIATVGGRAQIKLYSGCSGTATVTAEFDDDRSGVGASTSLTIKFGPPTKEMKPVEGSLRFTCAAVNIGALREPVPDIQLECDLNAQTRGGTALPAAALQPVFRTEAGSLSIKDDPYSCERKLIYSPLGGAAAPRDVEADLDLNEPHRIDDNGLERNPRDGLVTSPSPFSTSTTTTSSTRTSPTSTPTKTASGIRPTATGTARRRSGRSTSCCGPAGSSAPTIRRPAASSTTTPRSPTAASWSSRPTSSTPT